MKEKILEICKEVNNSIDYSSDKLVEDGFMDSVTLVEIASEIMDVFDIDLPYEEIVPENFNSLDSMVKLVEKYV